MASSHANVKKGTPHVLLMASAHNTSQSVREEKKNGKKRKEEKKKKRKEKEKKKKRNEAHGIGHYLYKKFLKP